jgi:hypothetical protein
MTVRFEVEGQQFTVSDFHSDLTAEALWPQ